MKTEQYALSMVVVDGSVNGKRRVHALAKFLLADLND